MPSERQVFAFFCSAPDHRPQNSGCSHTAQRFHTAWVISLGGDRGRGRSMSAYLRSRRNFVHRSERRQVPGADICSAANFGRGRDASYLAPPAQSRTCGFPAYGSHLGSKRQAVAVCVPAPVTREPGAESSACFASPHSPWSTPFAPPTPLRLTPPRTAPQWGATLFAGFTATMAGSDFSCPCIIGYGSSPSRCGPSRSRNI